MVVDPRWTENQEVFRAASGSAGELIPALARIIESGSWREFQHPMHGLQRYETFAAYCDDFVGISALAVEAMLGRSSNRRAAMTVRELLREAIPPARAQGEIGNGRSRLRDTKSTSEQDDVSYVVARLKRDDPDIANAVINGTITPNAAATRAHHLIDAAEAANKMFTIVNTPKIVNERQARALSHASVYGESRCLIIGAVTLIGVSNIGHLRLNTT